MREHLTQSEFNELRNFLERASGIHIHDGKQFLFESRLGPFLHAENIANYAELIQQLRVTSDHSLAMRVVDLMTTNETLWFRDRYPFRTFRDKIVPELAEEIKTGKRNKIKLWVAASSTGQEPYSLAMIWLESCQTYNFLQPHMFSILATDINDQVLAKARGGRFDRYAMARGLPGKYRRKYFRPVGRNWQIDDDVRALIEFRKFNLQNPLTSLGKFDIVFCRNVLIYFQDDFKRQLFQGFHELLKPPGLLFLGASESARLYSRKFRLRTHERCVYYEAH